MPAENVFVHEALGELNLICTLGHMFNYGHTVFVQTTSCDFLHTTHVMSQPFVQLEHERDPHFMPNSDWLGKQPALCVG